MKLVVSFAVLFEMLVFSYGNGQLTCFNGKVGATCKFVEDMCFWNEQGWTLAMLCPNTQRRQCADFNTHEKTTGSLTSQQLCSTRSTIHCLKFDYKFLHQDRNTTKLSVILHTNKGGTQTVWQLVSTEEGLRTAFVPLKTESHFKIEIKVERPDRDILPAGSRVVVDKILYESSKCTLKPLDARVATVPKARNAQSPTTATTTTTTTMKTTRKLSPVRGATTAKRTHPSPSPTRTTSTTTTTLTANYPMAPDSSTPSTSGDRSEGAHSSVVGTIISVVAALVVVVVCIVAAVLRQKQMGCWKRRGASKAGCRHSWPHQGDARAVRGICTGAAASAPVPGSDHYSSIDDANLNIIKNNSNNNSSNNSNYLSSSSQATPPIYTTVQKPRKGSKPTDDAMMSSQSGTCAAFSKQGAGGWEEGEYKRLNFHRGLGKVAATPGPGDGGGVYARLQSVNHTAAAMTGSFPGDAGNSTVETGTGSSQPEAGFYHVLDEVPEKPGPRHYAGEEKAYNSLDFAGHGWAPGDRGGEGEGGGVYHQAGAWGDDAYSHVHRDRKPQVVADALYSHIL